MRPPMPSMMMSRRSKILISVVVILIVLIIALVKLSGVYINYLWFGEVGHRNVYGTIFWTRTTLFFVFGLLMALIIGGNLIVSYVLKPPFRPMSPEQQNLQHYVMIVEPRRKLILAVVMVIALLSAGASAQSDWASWQLFFHGGSFGQTDPQFHRDISFYAWDYPVYRLLLSFGFTAIIFSIILSVGIHYLTGAIRLQTPGPKITVSARRHLTALVFVFMALKAVAYWLDRYGLVFSDRSKFTGASYTDIHSALPAKTILFWITIVLAVGVLASIWLKSVLLPGIGFVALLVVSILIGGLYPAIVQQVSVKPNASVKERPYISRNIDATRQAYGIVTAEGDTANGGAAGGTVTYQKYAADASPSTTALTTDQGTVSNVRILDPNVLSPTFAQQQAQQKNYYGFPPKLDVDRYDVGGSMQDFIVGVRELSAARLSGNQTNWINQHTAFTHGYGFVAAAANENVTTSENYADGNIPQSGSLNDAVKLTTPQAYYGELLSDYAIVGARGAPQEFDGDGAAKIRYQGKGGISLSSPLTKLAFAVNYKETNFLLNDAVSASGAKILINRNPRDRLAKVAPFLKVDGDPYPIVDKSSGHIVWVLDGYTTMANYPYSERNSLSDLTSDSLTSADRTAGQPNDTINYIRNSVKATVDAYDGTVRLYDWDSSDPVLKAWMKVFPGLVLPKKDMPSTIEEHVRYPEDLFDVQRSVLEQYHVTNPVTFYNTSDKWTVPSDPAPGATGDQPPYYVLADPLDGTAQRSQFQLTSPMKVNQKSNLASYISVNSDPTDKNYGKMTILTVPAGTVIQGPEQIANNLNSTDVISSYITLQDRAGSQVIHGNLLTLPLGKSFLYVEPLYVQAQKSGFPLLRRVLVYYGNKAGFAATLKDALNDLQPGHSTGETVQNGSDSTDPSTNPSGSPSSSPSSTPSSGSSSTPSTGSSSTSTGATSTQALLAQLASVEAALAKAKSSGDYTGYAAALARQSDLVAQLLKSESSSAVPSTPKASPTG